MKEGSHNTIKQNQKFTTGKGRPKKASHECLGTKTDETESSEDDQNNRHTIVATCIKKRPWIVATK